MVVEVLSSSLALLNSLWQTIKGTRNLTSPENRQILENNETRKTFLNNNPNAIIIQVQGNMYLGDSDVLNSREKQRFNNIFSEKNNFSGKQIDIIESDFYERIKKLKLNLPQSKKINQFTKYLESDINNILSLSIYAKRLFDGGDSNEAKKIREDIGLQYGKEGRCL